MRKLLCLMIALVACLMLATVVFATEAEATVPTTCAAGCENPVWEPLPAGSWALLEAGHYHYYLTDNDSTYRLTPNPNSAASGKNSAAAVTICLDLNGYHISTKGRALGIYKDCTLNLMDSSADKTGYVAGGKGTNNAVGGTIFNYGTFNLYDTVLKFAPTDTDHATYGGGVLWQEGEYATFNMYGGKLIGAQLTASDSGTSRGATIYATKGAINLYGGDIISGATYGGKNGPCVYLNSNAVQFTLSGGANVDQIYVNTSKAKINIDGTYSGKARVHYDSGITLKAGATAGAATNNPNITGDLFCTNGDGWLMNVSGSSLKLETFTPNGERHYCEHCKEVVRWTSMTTSNYTTPNTTPGKYHYYLAANRNVYVQVGDGADLCLDLYGKTLYRTGRVLLPNKGSQLNLMDSVGGGLVRADGAGGNPRGGVITVSGGSVFNMYGGTLMYKEGKNTITETGGIAAIGGATMNMYGGTILGADLVKPDEDTPRGAAFYLYNSASIFNIYGGTITAGTLPNGEGLGACGYVVEGGQVTLAGDAQVDNILFAKQENKLIVEGIYTGTASVSYVKDTGLSLGAQVGVSKDAVLDGGKITCGNNGYVVIPQEGKLVLSLDAVAVVVTESGVTTYNSLQEAVDAYESGYIQLLATPNEDVTINKDLRLELDGKSVNGTITVAEGKTLQVSDAQTDDFTVADSIYGKLTVTGNVAAADGYLMITEEAKVSFHKVELAIHTMSLRPDVAGIYYKSDFRGDEKVAPLVESYGIALSVIDVPYEKNLNTKCVSSEFTGFVGGASGNAGNSTLLKGILKTTNEEKINGRNLAMEIYGRPYIKTAAGYIFGEPVSRNLAQQLEAADALTEGLTASQWYGLEDFCKTYENVLVNVTMANIRAGLQDDTLSLLMVGNSFCYYYVEELYGLLMANPDPNRGYDKVEIFNVYYSGCSLTSHYQWWTGGAANYQVYCTNENGRNKMTHADGTEIWSLEDSLQLGRWDYISLQGTKKDGSYTVEDLSPLCNDIAALAGPLLDRFHELHPEAQLLWHRTWAFEIGRVSSGYTYTEESLAKYDAGMQKVCDWMTTEFDKDRDYDLKLINSGAAWTVARQENAKLETSLIPVEGGLCARLGVTGKDSYPYYPENPNAGDGYHDGDIGGAQFLNACVWYESLTGQSVLENDYKPTKDNGKYELADAFAELLRNAAHSVNKTN